MICNMVREELIHLHDIAHTEAINTHDIDWIKLEIAYRRILDGIKLTPMQASVVVAELEYHADKLQVGEAKALTRFAQSLVNATG